MAEYRFKIAGFFSAAALAALCSIASAQGVRSLPVINGTVSDNAGGSGVASVVVNLRRQVAGTGALEFWGKRNGVWDWATETADIPATISGGNWSVSNSSPAGTVLPSGDKYLDGSYLVSAKATDNAGNVGNSSVNSFMVDGVAPSSVVISTPTEGATVQTINTINGTAVDNTNGSGIGRVVVYLRRRLANGTLEYWGNRSGTWGWGTGAVGLDATLSGNNWSVGNGSPAGTVLPSGANLTNGAYLANASAYDKAGNTTAATIRQFNVGPADTVAPTSVIISSPTEGATIQALTAINGTASDNAGGSGLSKVVVYLRRRLANGTLEYWGNRSGTWGWGTGAVALDTTLSGNNWSVGNGSPAGTVLPSGANLTNGAYLANASAYDKAGNTTAATIRQFNVGPADTVAPTSVIISSPTEGATIQALTAINGTASDNAGGSGLSKVVVYLRRRLANGTLEYWGNRSGTWGWGTGAVALDTTLSGNNWSVGNGSPAGTVLPSGANLTNGAYLANASAYDKAGNTTAATIRQFNVGPADTVAPTSVIISSPTEGATIQALTAINGTASDNAGGSGLSKVVVYLRRRLANGTLEYWGNRSGTWGWGTGAVGLDATLSGNNWSVGNGSPAGTVLPSGANLTNGAYLANASAYDKAGNTTAATIRQFNVGPADTVAPTSVIISSPTEGATIQALTAINGTASDNAGGSGLSKVVVYLRRRLSNGTLEYWGNRSGTWGWGTGAVALDTTLSGNNWSVSNGSPAGTVLPSGSDLQNGVYLANASAYDKAGNMANATLRTFNVASAGLTGGPASPVTLSTARASANGTITLQFTGAVKTSTAVNGSSYNLTVNGVYAAVRSVTVSNGYTTVVLSDIEGGLYSGDKLSLQYNLQDQESRAINGQVNLTVN